MADIKFTPTQEKLLAILSDGEPHTREELHSVCHPLSKPSIVATHMNILRKLLNKRGETVVNEYFRGVYRYRHVRLLNK